MTIDREHGLLGTLVTVGGERDGERRVGLASYLAEQVRQRFELTVTL